MDHELVCGLVKSRSCLEGCNVRAVSEFGLGVATEYVTVADQWKPPLSLLLIGHVLHGNHEHRQTKTDSRRRALEVIDPQLEGVAARVMVLEILLGKLRVRFDELCAGPQITLLLIRSQLVKLKVIDELWMLSEVFMHLYSLS